MDCSPVGSSIHGISQARIVECIAISFSRGSSQLRDQTHASCIGRHILYHLGSPHLYCRLSLIGCHPVFHQLTPLLSLSCNGSHFGWLANTDLGAGVMCLVLRVSPYPNPAPFSHLSFRKPPHGSDIQEQKPAGSSLPLCIWHLGVSRRRPLLLVRPAMAFCLPAHLNNTSDYHGKCGGVCKPGPPA